MTPRQTLLAGIRRWPSKQTEQSLARLTCRAIDGSSGRLANSACGWSRRPARSLARQSQAKTNKSTPLARAPNRAARDNGLGGPAGKRRRPKSARQVYNSRLASRWRRRWPQSQSQPKPLPLWPPHCSGSGCSSRQKGPSLAC